MHDRRAPARFGGHPGYRPRSRFLQGRRTSGPTRYGYRWNFVRGYCAGAVGFGDGAGCVALEGAAPPSSTPAMERAAAVAFCSVPTGNTSCLAVTGVVYPGADSMRSEEHTSELQSLMRISYAVFCLKKKKRK